MNTLESVQAEGSDHRENSSPPLELAPVGARHVGLAQCRLRRGLSACVEVRDRSEQGSLCCPLGMAKAFEICAGVAGRVDQTAIPVRDWLKRSRQSIIDDEMVAVVEMAAPDRRIATELGDVGH